MKIYKVLSIILFICLLGILVYSVFQKEEADKQRIIAESNEVKANMQKQQAEQYKKELVECRKNSFRNIMGK